MTKAIKTASALLALALACTVAAWSQQTQAAASTPTHPSINSYKQSPERYFRLTFRVLDVSAEGKVTTSRSYTETIATGVKSERTSSIRTGDRVPVATGSYSAGGASVSSLVNTQFQYLNTGTNIDVEQAEIVDRALHLHVKVSISTFAPTPSSYMPTNDKHPLIRDANWDSNVTVPIGKPTVIFSSDNNTGKGKIELELTAAPINQ
ncbi:MAG: hypothetical protein WAM66_08860 [Acidobacteriaceae bacterium]